LTNEDQLDGQLAHDNTPRRSKDSECLIKRSRGNHLRDDRTRLHGQPVAVWVQPSRTSGHAYLAARIYAAGQRWRTISASAGSIR
jgi:hypothetical protein